jgi:hypothetical protein
MRPWRGGLLGPDLGPFRARFRPLAGGGGVVCWGSWCSDAAGRRSVGGSPAAVDLEGQVWVFGPDLGPTDHDLALGSLQRCLGGLVMCLPTGREHG